MNWVILGGILITGAISKTKPKLAGWLGVVLTTAVLLWGLSIYGEAGKAVSFFGIGLSRMAFLAFMGVLYGLSLAQLRKAFSD